MASSINAKSIHRDGKSRIMIGVDENSKTLEGDGKILKITNKDGSAAKISNENIIGMPDDVSEKNRLVTQEDLKKMMKNIEDIIESANQLAKIVGGLEEEEE